MLWLDELCRRAGWGAGRSWWVSFSPHCDRAVNLACGMARLIVLYENLQGTGGKATLKLPSPSFAQNSQQSKQSLEARPHLGSPKFSESGNKIQTPSHQVSSFRKMLSPSSSHHEGGFPHVRTL